MARFVIERETTLPVASRTVGWSRPRGWVSRMGIGRNDGHGGAGQGGFRDLPCLGLRLRHRGRPSINGRDVSIDVLRRPGRPPVRISFAKNSPLWIFAIPVLDLVRLGFASEIISTSTSWRGHEHPGHQHRLRPGAPSLRSAVTLPITASGPDRRPRVKTVDSTHALGVDVKSSATSGIELVCAPLALLRSCCRTRQCFWVSDARAGPSFARCGSASTDPVGVANAIDQARSFPSNRSGLRSPSIGVTLPEIAVHGLKSNGVGLLLDGVGARTSAARPVHEVDRGRQIRTRLRRCGCASTFALRARFDPCWTWP